MNTSKAVANRIIELCEEKGLTVNALSMVSAVPQSTVNDIVTGTSKNVGIITIKKLCDGFEISLSQFFNTQVFKTLEQEIR